MLRTTGVRAWTISDTMDGKGNVGKNNMTFQAKKWRKTIVLHHRLWSFFVIKKNRKKINVFFSERREIFNSFLMILLEVKLNISVFIILLFSVLYLGICTILRWLRHNLLLTSKLVASDTKLIISLLLLRFCFKFSNILYKKGHNNTNISIKQDFTILFMNKKALKCWLSWKVFDVWECYWSSNTNSTSW